jgi:transposase
MSSRIKDRPVCRLRDLPHGSVPLRLWVCKHAASCAPRSFARVGRSELSYQVPARSRLIKRLRTKVSAAVTARTGRSVTRSECRRVRR